jgi:hypothetical protein
VSRLDDVAGSGLQNFLIRNIVGGEGRGHFRGHVLECPSVASLRDDSHVAEVGSGDVNLTARNKVLDILSLNLTVTALLPALAAGSREGTIAARAFPEVAERLGSDVVVVLGPASVQLVSLICVSNHERRVEFWVDNWVDNVRSEHCSSDWLVLSLLRGAPEQATIG